jgi:hypothetical protein
MDLVSSIHCSFNFAILSNADKSPFFRAEGEEEKVGIPASGITFVGVLCNSNVYVCNADDDFVVVVRLFLVL